MVKKSVYNPFLTYLALAYSSRILKLQYSTVEASPLHSLYTRINNIGCTAIMIHMGLVHDFSVNEEK